MSVVTRFAPSPTGFLHIGGARTALFSWLYARHHKGKFLLRIEDTDRARHNEEAVEAIIASMAWLGLDWDGDAVSQYARRARHAAVAQELVSQGKAYYCYCSKEELEAMRTHALREGMQSSYNRKWRDKSPSDAPKGIEPVIRIKAPLSGSSIIEDEVQGQVEIENAQLDDFILLRSDGSPTYMLSVVVDDYDMGITHIIRGDDHLNNAFRQKVIIDAMGWPLPRYAHIPLILGQDGTKLSKRHGAVSVEKYANMGYLPDAMRNYLLRLGWSHGDHEIISTEQAIEWFNLESIGKSAARFDFDKLDSLNHHYIRMQDNEALFCLLTSFYEKEFGITPDNRERDMILVCMDEFKDRSKTLLEMARDSSFFLQKIPYDFHEKAAKELQNPDSTDVLDALKDVFSGLEDFTVGNIEAGCRDVAAGLRNGKLGKVGMPLRYALTGRPSTPSIFLITAAFGKEEVLARLEYVLANFSEQKKHKQGN